MNVFIHILRSLIIAAIASIGIYAGYSYFADVRTPQILETPKNTDVITLLNHVNEDKLPANPDDMCIDYLKNLEDKKNSKPKPEDLNVQDIIGYQNNKFGLYIYRVDSFAEKAAEMVNSNGGDWGYVLVPYNVKDYDEEKWAKFFETLHRYHLIPIIQLWDTSKDFETQVKETRKAAQFLNNLRWPIKYRYIPV